MQLTKINQSRKISHQNIFFSNKLEQLVNILTRILCSEFSAAFVDKVKSDWTQQK